MAQAFGAAGRKKSEESSHPLCIILFIPHSREGINGQTWSTKKGTNSNGNENGRMWEKKMAKLRDGSGNGKIGTQTLPRPGT